MRFTSLAIIAASAVVVRAVRDPYPMSCFWHQARSEYVVLMIAYIIQQTQHQIFVGANGTLTYSPPNITAAVGDLVTFVFQSGNHVGVFNRVSHCAFILTNTSCFFGLNHCRLSRSRCSTLHVINL